MPSSDTDIRRTFRVMRHAALLAVTLLTSACLADPTPSDPVTTNPINSTTLSSLLSKLTLSDEDDFSGGVNAPPDPRMWNIDIGNRWGNGKETQAYTADPANVRQDGAGHLVLEATTTDGRVTSARINTEGKTQLTDGLIAARIKMPAGQGLHPAFWMLGSSLRTAGWPACGEIDIVEFINDGSLAYFTIHGPPSDTRQAGPDGDVQLQSTKASRNLVDEFHTYWMYKQSRRVIMGIDDNQVAAFSADHLRQGWKWVYDGPFFAVLNVAVGGDWPGPLTPGVLPKQMVVDWIRLYR
jgi:beta-glucanase (GH16 family)